MLTIEQKYQVGMTIEADEVFTKNNTSSNALAFSVVRDDLVCPMAVPGSRLHERVLALVPWTVSWGEDYVCSCGMRWNSEESFTPEDVMPSWDERKIGRYTFQTEAPHALPAGSQAVVSNSSARIIMAVLPDGTRLLHAPVEFAQPTTTPIKTLAL